MDSLRFTRLLWYCLALLLAFGYAAPTKPKNSKVVQIKPEPGSLGIQLDWNLFTEGGEGVLFSSVITLDEPPNLSKKEFKELAIDAFVEMDKMAIQYKFGAARRPTVMTTLITGNQIFFASSLKNGDQVDLDPQTAADLAECKKGNGNNHKNQGRCGEIMTFDDYYRNNGIADRLNDKSRIVAITIPRDYAQQRRAENNKDKPADIDRTKCDIVAPCGDGGDKWGCDKFVGLKKLQVLDNNQIEQEAKAGTTQNPFYSKLRQLLKDGKVEPTQTHANLKPKPGPEPKPTDDDDGPPAENTKKPGPSTGAPGRDPKANPDDEPPKTNTWKDDNNPPENTKRPGSSGGQNPDKETPPENTKKPGSRPGGGPDDQAPPENTRKPGSKPDNESPPENTKKPGSKPGGSQTPDNEPPPENTKKPGSKPGAPGPDDDTPPENNRKPGSKPSTPGDDAPLGNNKKPGPKPAAPIDDDDTPPENPKKPTSKPGGSSPSSGGAPSNGPKPDDDTGKKPEPKPEDNKKPKPPPRKPTKGH